MKNTKYSFVFLILSLIGLGDTSYLFAKYLQGVDGVCLFTQGCDAVLGSSYAVVLGVPMSFWGLVFYFLVFASSVFFIYSRLNLALYLLFALSSIGLLVSVFLFYLQAFVIESFCEFCILSAVTSCLLFATSVVVFLRNRDSSFYYEQD